MARETQPLSTDNMHSQNIFSTFVLSAVSSVIWASVAMKQYWPASLSIFWYSPSESFVAVVSLPKSEREKVPSFFSTMGTSTFPVMSPPRIRVSAL